MDAQGEEGVELLIIHEVGTRCGEWSASRPGRDLSQGKDPWYPLDRKLGGPQSWSGHNSRCRGSNLDRPVVQSIVRHYTDRPTPDPN
jgi:hypothetical protein